VKGSEQKPGTDDASARRSFFLQLARYSQLAFVLPACTVTGWLIGAGLDRWLHTSWIYLAGLLLGIAAGFVELVRTVISRESSKD
jgi:F0F1-type ATP synthase assembly protein I